MKSWKAFTFCEFDPSSAPLTQRFQRGSTCQSRKKPCEVRSVDRKDAPIEVSGTATITLRTPWFSSLSRPRNMSARDLPAAGGALSRMNCAPRAS